MSDIISYQLLKSIHLVGMVSWFAALFYFPRLLIYFVEAQEKPASEKQIIQDQLRIMMRRLWKGIAIPAMLATVVFGVWLLIDVSLYKATWMHGKLLLVVGLIGYHHYLGALGKKAQAGKPLPSSYALRMINEGATLFLIAIIGIVVFKARFNWYIGLAVLTVLSALMWTVIRRCSKGKCK